MNNAAFGTTRAELDVSVSDVYKVFAKTVLISIVVAFIMVGAGVLVFQFIGMTSFKTGRPSQAMIFFIGVLFVALYLLYRIIVQSFFRTRMTNLIWDHSKLEIICFESHQRARDLASIIAGNALLTFITLGFYWPWAKIQLAKYYADTLLIYAPGDLNNFVADDESGVAATGDEVTEALDVDFSF